MRMVNDDPKMEPPRNADLAPMPLWQSALIAQGCHVDSGSQILPLKLEPAGECLLCTPACNGWMLPFHTAVMVGQTVSISWDSQLSRYLVEVRGEKTAA